MAVEESFICGNCREEDRAYDKEGTPYCKGCHNHLYTKDYEDCGLVIYIEVGGRVVPALIEDGYVQRTLSEFEDYLGRFKEKWQ